VWFRNATNTVRTCSCGMTRCNFSLNVFSVQAPSQNCCTAGFPTGYRTNCRRQCDPGPGLRPFNTAQLPNGFFVSYISKPDVAFLSREICKDMLYFRHGVALQPGDTVVDVGANIGMFANYCAEIVGSQVIVYSKSQRLTNHSFSFTTNHFLISLVIAIRSEGKCFCVHLCWVFWDKCRKDGGGARTWRSPAGEGECIIGAGGGNRYEEARSLVRRAMWFERFSHVCAIQPPYTYALRCTRKGGREREEKRGRREKG
jgi:hypothetical protein